MADWNQVCLRDMYSFISVCVKSPLTGEKNWVRICQERQGRCQAVGSYVRAYTFFSVHLTFHSRIVVSSIIGERRFFIAVMRPIS